MGLFDLFRGKKSPVPDEEDVARLAGNGELPWGWYSANIEFVREVECQYDYFCQAVYSGKKEGAKAEYAALMSLLKFREDVERLCTKKGRYFLSWASISVLNPVSVDEDKARLRYLEENMADLVRNEAALEKLKQDILTIVSAEPGVIQTDLYKRFDPALKGTVSNELYHLEGQGVIVREKNGRSYKLYIK